MPRTRNGRVDKARPNIAQNEGTDRDVLGVRGGEKPRNTRNTRNRCRKGDISRGSTRIFTDTRPGRS